MAEPQLGLELINAEQDWDVRKIIGREDVNGVPQHLVEWCPTLETEHSLGHAMELVHEFEAQLEAQRRVKGGRWGLGSKIKKQVVVEADTPGGQQKKRRGRPRKQK